MDMDCPIPPQHFWVCDNCERVKTRDELSDKNFDVPFFHLIVCKECAE